MKNGNIIKGKFIILGDCHFGIKQSSFEYFEKTQLVFFIEQLIPYMKKHNIKTIIQLGDFLDNRTTLDIRLWNRIKREILNVLLEEDIRLITLLGNHDISYKNTRCTSFMYSIEKMYSNITLVNNAEMFSINNCNFLLQPWLLPNENILNELLLKADYVAGHFELMSFEMTKGHINEHGQDVKDFKLKNIKKVFSGHFHIRQKKGKIDYVGTPFQLSYGDYCLRNGFVVIDEEFNEKFIDNTSSSKYVKLKYNDENEKPLEISGLYNNKRLFDLNNIPFSDIKKHYCRFFVNKAKDSKFEEYIYILKQNGIEFEVINNQEISNLIGMDYLEDNIEEEDTKTFIIDSIKNNENVSDNAMKLLFEIFDDVAGMECL